MSHDYLVDNSSEGYQEKEMFVQFDAFLKPDNIRKAELIEVEGGLTYNADSICIEGTYVDELSQHRAKKQWCTILETDFLLIPDADFEFTLSKDPGEGQFQISCSFNSACGRYAFWRLINEQVPEIQFLLETAHMSHRYKDYSSLINHLEHTPQGRCPLLLNSIGRLLKSAIKQLKQLTFITK